MQKQHTSVELLLQIGGYCSQHRRIRCARPSADTTPPAHAYLLKWKKETAWEGLSQDHPVKLSGRSNTSPADAKTRRQSLQGTTDWSWHILERFGFTICYCLRQKQPLTKQTEIFQTNLVKGLSYSSLELRVLHQQHESAASPHRGVPAQSCRCKRPR